MVKLKLEIYSHLVTIRFHQLVNVLIIRKKTITRIYSHCKKKNYLFVLETVCILQSNWINSWVSPCHRNEKLYKRDFVNKNKNATLIIRTPIIYVAFEKSELYWEFKNFYTQNKGCTRRSTKPTFYKPGLSAKFVNFISL